MDNVEYRISKSDSGCRSCGKAIRRGVDRCLVITQRRRCAILCARCTNDMIDVIAIAKLDHNNGL